MTTPSRVVSKQQVVEGTTASIQGRIRILGERSKIKNNFWRVKISLRGFLLYKSYSLEEVLKFEIKRCIMLVRSTSSGEITILKGPKSGVRGK